MSQIDRLSDLGFERSINGVGLALDELVDLRGKRADHAASLAKAEGERDALRAAVRNYMLALDRQDDVSNDEAATLDDLDSAADEVRCTYATLLAALETPHA